MHKFITSFLAITLVCMAFAVRPAFASHQNTPKPGKLKGTIALAPSCPVSSEVKCKVKISVTRTIQIYDASLSSIVASDEVQVKKKSRFSFKLAPGTYYVVVDPPGYHPGECETVCTDAPRQIVISERETTELDIVIDPGIRFTSRVTH